MHGTIQRKRIDPRWTDAEDEILLRHYPDHESLTRLLPHRTYNACKTRAHDLSIKTIDREKDLTTAELKRLKALCECFSSVEVIASIMGRRMGTVHAALRRRGYELKKPKPVTTGFPLYDEVRMRAHEMGIAYRDLDRSLGYRSKHFSKANNADGVSISMIANAVEALGGRLVIEWEALDGETGRG